MIDKIKEFLSGKKTYILMGLGVLVALVQYATGLDFGMSELPPAVSIGDLVQQIYVFIVGASARAAIAK